MKNILYELVLTVLSVSAWPRRKFAVVQPFIEKSEVSDIELTYEEKQRELIKACYNKNVTLVQTLLSNNAELSFKSISVNSDTNDEEFNKIMRKKQFKNKSSIKLSDITNDFEIRWLISCYTVIELNKICMLLCNK